jgi:hypothetical protein
MKKKKKKRSKRREDTVPFLKRYDPAIDYDNSDWDDVPMPVTYVSDHDWEKHSTFNIENLFGTNSKVNNCCTISTIHVPSYNDMFDEYALRNSCSLVTRVNSTNVLDEGLRIREKATTRDSGIEFGTRCTQVHVPAVEDRYILLAI